MVLGTTLTCQDQTNRDAASDRPGESERCGDETGKGQELTTTPAAETGASDTRPGDRTPVSEPGAGRDGEVAPGEVAPNDTEPLDGSDWNAAPEASSGSDPNGPATQPDQDQERQGPAEPGHEPGHGRKADTRDGDHRDTPPAEEVAVAESQPAVVGSQSSAASDAATAETPGKDGHRGEPGAAGAGQDQDEGPPSGNGPRTERRNEAERNSEAGGTPDPDASTNPGTEPLRPEGNTQDDGDTGGGDPSRDGTSLEAPAAAETTRADSTGQPAADARPPSEIATGDDSPAGEAPSPATSEAPTEDVTTPGATADGGESDPPGEEPVTAPDASSLSDGSGNVPVDRGGSSTSTDTKAYRIVKTRQSANSFDAAVVVDDDPGTAWSTHPARPLDEAYVVLDLGKPRSIGSVRWLVAPDGLAGTLRVEVSTDGKRWKKVAGVGAGGDRRLAGAAAEAGGRCAVCARALHQSDR